MKKIILGIILSSILLSGCGAANTTLDTKQKLEQNTVTKTGTISTKVGDEYLLNTTDGIVNMTSNKVNLDSYLKKKVTVTGMFSGSTLYVDKLESN